MTTEIYLQTTHK